MPELVRELAPDADPERAAAIARTLARTLVDSADKMRIVCQVTDPARIYKYPQPDGTVVEVAGIDVIAMFEAMARLREAIDRDEPAEIKRAAFDRLDAAADCLVEGGPRTEGGTTTNTATVREAGVTREGRWFTFEDGPWFKLEMPTPHEQWIRSICCLPAGGALVAAAIFGDEEQVARYAVRDGNDLVFRWGHPYVLAKWAANAYPDNLMLRILGRQPGLFRVDPPGEVRP
jgi:hypothetical protein